MWPFGQRTKKQELKRVQPVHEPGRIAMVAQNLSVANILVCIGFIVLISMIVIMGGQVMPWRLSQKPMQDIRVRTAFQVLDLQSTEKARQQARESTPNYYKLNSSFLEQVEQELTGLYTNLQAVQEVKSLSKDKKFLFEKKWKISPKQLASIKKAISKISPETFRKQILDFRKTLIRSNFIEVMPTKYRKANVVVLIDPKEKIRRKTDKWVFTKNSDSTRKLISDGVKVFSPELREVIKNYLLADFKPVWLFDKAHTDKQRLLRYTSDANLKYQKYQAGVVLVERNHAIGKPELRLLELEHNAYWKSIEPQKKIVADAGTATLLAIIMLGLWIYCFKFQRRAVHNWSRTLALSSSILFMVALARIGNLSGLNNYTTVFEVVLLGMVMTIAYNQRFALTVTVGLICLLMITLNGDVSLLLTLLAGGVTAIITLDEIRSRSKIIEVATASAAISFAVIWASQLADFQDMVFILRNALSAAGGALLAGFIVQGILPLIEQLFQISTSMTLLEWSDPSKPLLKRLAIEVPGTFNHSLLLGSLAESAAESVGGNGLLARVGSYYHDIGKLTKPEYFVENQPSVDFTRHKELTPAMSLLIIIGHVKDGLELAKDYGLPKILHQFIAEHHGTTLVEYFYHQASQQDKEVSDVEFRYPGPKPHSKESAIIMMADSVESATRALSEPTAGRIESTVHNVIQKKLEDGQFDECYLTLREIHIIEQSLTKTLCSIYHSRIKYPSQTETESEKGTSETTSVKVAKGS